MAELRGLGVSKGTAVGPVAHLRESAVEPPDTPSGDTPAAELARALSALSAVANELRRRAEIAGGAAYDVLQAQAMMAEDPEVADDVGLRTAKGASAARAIYDSFGVFRTKLAAAGEYMAARVADLDDVRDRAVGVCMGMPVGRGLSLDGVCILVARDLAPADTAVLDLDLVLAIVTAEGGPTSHTAIVARERGIPAVVGCPDALSLPDGEMVAVDGSTGTVTTGATAESATSVRRPVTIRPLVRPGATSDGHPVALLANVGGPDDAKAAAVAGAEGIGLLRTELLFLESTQAPTVDVQRGIYRQVMEAFAGRKVVVRVLDAGADKPLPFLDMAVEPNPALGVRGLRALRVHPDVLDAQLEAIAAANADRVADVWVMAPMVSDAADARWFVERARSFGLPTIGAMIEVPSAAVTAATLIEDVDFVSVGTNDLTQYVLAADRMVGALGALQDPWHPAVLQLLATIGRAGVDAGKPVGICGEAAADPLLAPVLVGLGVTSLSMSRAALADVGDALAAVALERCREMASAAVRARDGESARDAVRSILAGEAQPHS
jgi:phosphotransferase system enzyme I (PtsI)